MNARRTTRPRSLSHAERSLITLLVAALDVAIASMSTDATQPPAAPLGLAVLYAEASGNAAPPLASPDAALHTLEGEFAGLAGIDRFEATLADSFSELTFATESVETVGDLVIVDFTMSGLHTGAYLAMPPNCAGIEVAGRAMLKTNDAGIGEQWIDYDRQALVEQIHAFSRLDAGESTACTGDVLLQAAIGAVVPAGAPACIGSGRCELPF